VTPPDRGRPPRALVRIAAVLAATAVAALGLYGAYGYGQDYNLHRGFTALVRLPQAGTGRLLSVGFYSAALHRRADYMVYLSPGYSPRHRYPVDFLLHGTPGWPHEFVTIANMDVRLDNQLALGHLHPMVLVYPDGRIGNSNFSDSEWANTPSGNFESYVIEVMHNVDQRFATIPRRQDRVIAGLSAGAYGAINIALHYPSDFANVQSWSGYFTQTPTGVFANVVGVFLLLLMLIGSDASYALARNLRFDQVLVSRAPGLGPWLEALLLTGASALPGPTARIRPPALARSDRDRRLLAPILAGAAGAIAVVALVLPNGHARAQLSARPPAPAPPRSTQAPRSTPANAVRVASPRACAAVGTQRCARCGASRGAR